MEDNKVEESEKQVEVEQKQDKSLTKKESSYTYWVNNDPLFKEAQKKEYKPIPVNKQQQPPLQPVCSSKEHSAWNSKQLWEEKKLKTQDLLEYLKSQLDNKGVFTDSLDFEIMSIESAEGTCDSVSIRGKQRLGYELKVVVALQGVGVNIDQNGKLTLQITDDGDRDYISAEAIDHNFKLLIASRCQTVGDALSNVLKSIFSK